MHASSSITPSILFFLFLLVLYFSPAIGQPLYNICGGSRNFSANSTYQTNLNSLLTTLNSKTPTTGFSNATVGQIPEQVYGLAMCRGDVNATNCLSCLRDANRDALQLCPYDREDTIWYDYCLLRYTNEYFLSSFDNSKKFWMWNTHNATDVARFNQLMYLLMNATADHSSYNSTKKFATGDIGNYTADNPIIYGLTQCTPDMSGSNCRQCLQSLFNDIPTNQLNGKQGGRIVGVRCNFRYEVYKFYDGTPTISLSAEIPPAASPAPTPASDPEVQVSPPAPVEVSSASGSSGKKNSTVKVLVLAIVVPFGVAALLVSTICMIWRRKSPTKTSDNLSESNSDYVSSGESLFFDPTIIRVATANFSNENKIGQGGFGEVYKGLLPDGRLIAVKKLLSSSIQGIGELKNELALVAKLQHRNLVRLLGVCLQEEKLIIYEYVPNKSLDKFLFDPVHRQQLKWETRHKIICGVVRGLLYLHEESQLKIIHRDLKASNVLLDAEMNPKISDFGLAKLFGGDQTHGNTSRIAGTYGYMAPEYAMHGLFSNKSDIFSFGVLTLEIITGRKNNGISESGHYEDLLSYAWEKWSNGTIFDILDPIIAEHGSRSEILRCIHIALLCVQEIPNNRPDMSMVNVMLSSNSVSLNSPIEPLSVRMPTIASVGSASNSEGSKSDEYGVKTIPMSPNDSSITDLEPR